MEKSTSSNPQPQLSKSFILMDPLWQQKKLFRKLISFPKRVLYIGPISCIKSKKLYIPSLHGKTCHTWKSRKVKVLPGFFTQVKNNYTSRWQTWNISIISIFFRRFVVVVVVVSKTEISPGHTDGRLFVLSHTPHQRGRGTNNGTYMCLYVSSKGEWRLRQHA